MAQLLAAVAPDVLVDLLLLRRVFVVLVILIVLALVLLGLAPGSPGPLLQTAPPHLATVLTVMRLAAPVVVVSLVELLATILAHLSSLINSALLLLQSVDALLHPLAFSIALFDLLIGPPQVLNSLLEVVGQSTNLGLQLGVLLLVARRLFEVLPLNLVLVVDQAVALVFDVSFFDKKLVDQLLRLDLGLL